MIFQNHKIKILNFEEILAKYKTSAQLAFWQDKAKRNEPATVHLSGLHTSAIAFFVAAAIQKTQASQLIILQDKEQAAYLQNDLSTILPNAEVLFFPSSYKRSSAVVEGTRTDSSGIIMRTEVLNKTNTGKQLIIVSFPAAISEKVISQAGLEKNTLEIKTGDEIPVSFITEILIEYGFQRVDFVHEPGQYSVRGSIVDIYSFSNDFPYRVDFFGDEVESIRTFAVVSQLSKAKFDKISIIPDIQTKEQDYDKIPFLEFVPASMQIWSNNFAFLKSSITEAYAEDKKEDFISGTELQLSLNAFFKTEFSQKCSIPAETIIDFDISPQVDFNKNFQLLAENLDKARDNNFANYILTENPEQAQRLEAIFDSEEIQKILNTNILRKREAGTYSEIKEIKPIFEPLIGTIHKGFSDNNLKINCYTDHQIFGRYHKFKLKSVAYHKSKEALTLKEISSLKPGDFVVHSDHGIGKFGGLVTVDIANKKQEAIRLVYKNNVILLVNIHNLHKVSKYKGKEGTQPKVYKLGSGVWQKLKTKTKGRVKDIAKDLIALYAKRKEEKGFAFSPDSYLQNALESSFIYEDTPDQAKTMVAVKKDMESEVPMDRLVCGDVGFGKTEIAIRAAFKAVADNKQAAILVPTTILALQHFKTFEKRMKDMPCTISYLSRMRTSKENRATIAGLASGKIDIVIGTHRLVSKDVKFKDLGILIIDEEQKFGVSVKEKLKRFKLNVDTLTLTATPIPRTMQFSLMGARDLSIMSTPPPNRYPIITELHTFSEDLIRESINYEIQRNGQVFFIHNRIDTIAEIEGLINRLCPEVRTVSAHGRMTGPQLEKIMLDFINEEYGVLIATSIIESGLDIPNANTVIINNAQNFGLSDLHQLRGRVGRSDKKAFCYLLAPPMTSVSAVARRRLTAIENFSELGSGFNIAMQDLDIRGAGNMLGGEQSGYIADIGYETYQRILNEALLELKEEEFQHLFEDASNNKTPDEIIADFKFVTDCHLDTDLEVLLPESYIENSSERLKLYRELDKIEQDNELTEFADRIQDRFGEMPNEVLELLDAVNLRKTAISLAIEKIILKNKLMICSFVSKPNSPFYQTAIFGKVLEFLQKNPKKAEMLQTEKTLRIKFFGVKSVKSANDLLLGILKS